MRNIYKFTTEIPDHDGIIFPRFLKKIDSDEYYDFGSMINSNTIYSSRNHQLSNRSIQAHKFDILVDIDYFEIPIIKEFVIVCKDRSIGRAYFLLDYYIPSKGICIELDSDVHDELKDKIRDEYIESLGIKVVRIKDFLNNPNGYINYIKKIINSTPYKNIEFNYDCLISEFKNIIDLENRKQLRFIRPKWRKVIEVLNTEFPELKEKLINDKDFSMSISLHRIYELIPLREKQVRAYYPLINYLKEFGVKLTVRSEDNNQYTIAKKLSSKDKSDTNLINR